jgi:hypothetical protein
MLSDGKAQQNKLVNGCLNISIQMGVIFFVCLPRQLAWLNPPKSYCILQQNSEYGERWFVLYINT